MKCHMHAVLVTAYKDFPMLRRLVRRLDPVFFRAFVHIDRRSKITSGEMEELRELGCEVTKTHTVRWGSFTHLEAVLDLMRCAISVGDFDYIHVISGQDYPLKTPDEFARQCDGRIFIDCAPLAGEPDFIRERYELFDPFAPVLGLPYGAGTIYRLLDGISRPIQRRVGLRRTRFGPYRELYKGIIWSSFPAWVAERILSDSAAQRFLGSLRTTIIPEEVFFPSYFMNSDLACAVVYDDKRYTDWRRRDGMPPPAILDHRDTSTVLASGALFARKMNSTISAPLLDAIDARINHRSCTPIQACG